MVLSQLLFFNHGYHRYRGFIPTFFLNHGYSHKEKSHRYNCRTIPPVDQLPRSTFATCHPEFRRVRLILGSAARSGYYPARWVHFGKRDIRQTNWESIKGRSIFFWGVKANPSSNLEKPTLTEVKYFSIAMVDSKRVDDPEIILALGCRLPFLG